VSLFANFFNKKTSSGYFGPYNNGFIELNPPVNASLNEVTIHCGYNPDQAYTYFGESLSLENDIHAVVFEIFTENIIYIATKTSVLSLPFSKVSKFLSHFRFNSEYNDYTIQDLLKTGIANKTLTSEFLAKVLETPDIEANGIFHVGCLGLYLYFNDGYLTDFQPSDGLNSWAKEFKKLNPSLINAYETVARKYWGNDIPKIVNEINVQCEALASTPEFVKNQYVSLHKGEQNTINYKMLMVCHYNEQLSLDEFIDINHGRAKKLESRIETGTVKYVLGQYLYEFSCEGVLLNINSLK